ncbi:MAG TPA: ABC transporter ATP-binding protein [Bacteroidia bacterium]|nr:ABC transporter ATP-binding protein [Bacteroidia bacterium]
MKEGQSASRGENIRNSIRSIRNHVSPSQKKRLLWLSALIFVSALLDVFGLASILPVISAATKPELIHTDRFLSPFFEMFHFKSENNFLLFLIIAVLVFFIIKSAFGLFVNYIQVKLSSEIAVYLTKHQFSKFFALNYNDFQTLKTSDITKDIVANPNSYVQWIILSLITLFSELLIVVLIVAGIAIANIQLFAFIVVTVGPATWLISSVIRRKSGEIGTGVDINYPKALGAVTEALNGYIDIKLADKEQYYRNKFLVYQHRFQWYMMKYYFMNQVPFRTNEIVALLGIVVIFVYALFFSDGNQAIIGLIGLFAAASYRLMPSMNRIINCMNFLNVNQVSITNLDNFMNDYRDEQQKKKSDKEVFFEKEISIRNISFCFPDSDIPVINRLSFNIKKGEKIGFVGTSGSGKTTLMNILLRFYTENTGDVLVDDVKLTRDNMASWRKKIGYVKQDIFMIDGTIRENIAFGEDEVDESRLVTVIKQASLAKFVQSLPDGVNTLIGEHGSRLSGGQKQRIGIARSLYRNAEILIFDEATSALDNATEQEVTESIDSLSETNKTIFIIAHRITTLKNCDKIFELKNGEIAGVHKYHELVEKVL